MTVVIVTLVIVTVVIVTVVIMNFFSKNNFDILTTEENFEGQRFAILAMFFVIKDRPKFESLRYGVLLLLNLLAS